MSDPKRLLDSSPDEWLAEILARGVGETPTAASLEATLSAVSASGNASSAAAATKIAAAPAASKAGASVLLVAAKSAAIGGAAGLLVAGGLTQLPTQAPPAVKPVAGHVASSRPAAAKPEPSALVASAMPHTDEIDAGEGRPPSSVEARPAGSLPVRSGAASTPTALNALALEVAALDAVRDALKRGAAARALEHLASYEARFTAGELRLDALYHRMQAELGSGRLRAARATAERVLQAGAQGPYASRAREILAGMGGGSRRA